MALQLPNYTHKSIDLTDVYVKIIDFNGDKNSILIRVAIYKNEASSKDSAKTLQPLTFAMDLQNYSLSFEGMYAFLKTEPLFLNSVDLL